MKAVNDDVLSEGLSLLFVYGSLKRGQANHGKLGGAPFVSVTRTVAQFALRLVESYPALSPGVRSIGGELFWVSPARLSLLDEFEGDGYIRAEIDLVDGRRAVSYVSRVPDAGLPLEGDEW